ncbi:hypothetical protein SAMN05216229_101267 [Geopseudomonas sagittaria]|uniref:Uncharacterized protein n=1 Tax=Geopseudomonas sagittaria TaxID=1135990 RepID=A0A1I5P0U1_9GAMM|nr:hypothetical protein [Pseudomonas sagittaria]SFP27669.1 hypothetical protein SAMN05216229_101267 [Pseudomonas sagittaria]
MRIFDLFKRKPSNELPAEVATAIEAAHIILRPHGEEGDIRAVVQVAGHRGGWIHSAEEDARHLAALWPELSPGQLARAHQFIAASVRQRYRNLDAEQQGTRVTYANRYSRTHYESGYGRK